MITFKEHSKPGYPGRTIENAQADVTIAFAFDFNTAGEKLTREAVNAAGNIYLPVVPTIIPANVISNIAEIIHDGKIKTVNIAGNALDTCLKFNPKYGQGVVDAVVYNTLQAVFSCPGFNCMPEQIQSGGQSGFDESGLKAAVLLGIPALCICPKGWMFKDANGRTIKDEQQFKARFEKVYQLKEILN